MRKVRKMLRMKTTKIILFILILIFSFSISYAQDDVYYKPNNKQKKEKEEKDFNLKKPNLKL